MSEDTRNRFKSISELSRYLKKHLKDKKPGLKSQLKLSPQPPPSTLTIDEVGDHCLKAGVLVLFYPKNGRTHLVFIQRTATVSHHQNQISFPGGQKDENENIVEAALREAQEELGIRPDDLRIIGQLTSLYVQPSNYCIYPVVAVTENRPNFEPCPQEVAEIIEIPLDHLLDSRNLKQEIWNLRGREALVPFYHYQGYKIWGATAMILAELLDILSSG